MPAKKVTNATLIAIVSVLFSLSCPLSPAEAKANKSAKHAANSPTAQNDEGAIRAQMNALVKDLAEGNAKAVASLWTEDGEYVDEDGNQTRGRAQLSQRFAEIFEQDGKPQVELTPDNIRFLSDTVALSEGVTHQGGQATGRFSLLFVKQNGDWLISRGSETVLVAQTNYDYLRDLDWLVGEWTAERDGASLHLKADWVPSKNFILCKYEIKKPNSSEQQDVQIIGWDPKLQQPVSWSFDSSGGFGYGIWTKNGGKQWSVEMTGTERDGSDTKSTNVFAVSAPNSFSWTSMNRSVDGMAVGNTVPLQVQRVVR